MAPATRSRFRLPAATLALALACAPGPPARAAAVMVPPAPYRPKDFSLVKKDGLYHLFYIRDNTELPADQTEKDFGHAVSPDLHNWTDLAPVLAVDPAGWDNAHVWAPTVFHANGLWWMLYAGVSENDSLRDVQRLGLAVSSDLNYWSRVGDGPVFDATQVPWAWWQPRSGEPAFRDPFVMPDPANPGAWLLYYTASPASDTLATLVALARTSGAGFTAWSDVKPLWCTYWTYSYNTLTESPHVFAHDGLWFLFMTSNAGQALTYYTTTDPAGDPAAWTYRGRLANMLGGIDTGTWFASEYLQDGAHDYFAFVDASHVDLEELQWTGPATFQFAEPPLFHVTSMGWSTTPVREGNQVTLRCVAVNAAGDVVPLQAVSVDSAGVETPVPVDSVGVPASVAFPGDTALVVVKARRWPATTDTTTFTHLRVWTGDRSMESATLAIGPPSRSPLRRPAPQREPGAPAIGDDGGPDTSVAADPTERPRLPGRVYGLARAPLGAGAAVVVDLARAGEARVDLFDLQGRRVRNLAWRRLPAGTSVLAWDGRDAAGAAEPRGIYFVRLESGGRTSTARLLLAP